MSLKKMSRSVRDDRRCDRAERCDANVTRNLPIADCEFGFDIVDQLEERRDSRNKALAIQGKLRTAHRALEQNNPGFRFEQRQLLRNGWPCQVHGLGNSRDGSENRKFVK